MAIGCELGQIVKSLAFTVDGAPLVCPEPLPALIDASLQRFETVWAAAGTPRSVFEVAPAALIAAIPGAEPAEIAGAS